MVCTNWAKSPELFVHRKENSHQSKPRSKLLNIAANSFFDFISIGFSLISSSLILYRFHSLQRTIPKCSLSFSVKRIFNNDDDLLFFLSFCAGKSKYEKQVWSEFGWFFSFVVFLLAKHSKNSIYTRLRYAMWTEKEFVLHLTFRFLLWYSGIFRSLFLVQHEPENLLNCSNSWLLNANGNNKAGRTEDEKEKNL